MKYILALALASCAYAQTCTTTATITGNGILQFDNRTLGCRSWELRITQSNPDPLSVNFESTSDSAGSPNTALWTSVGPSSSGTNYPGLTGTQLFGNAFWKDAYGPWVRIRVAGVTGVNPVGIVLYGWLTPEAIGTSSSGGGLAFSSFGTDGMIPFRSGVGAVVGAAGLTWTTRLDVPGSIVTNGGSTFMSSGSGGYGNGGLTGLSQGMFFSGGTTTIASSGFGSLTRIQDSSGNIYLEADGTSNRFIRPLIVTQGTLTGASTPFISHTATWNNAATAYTGFLSNTIDTASASNSLLMDLQVGGTSRFKVTKEGHVTSVGSVTIGGGNSLGFSSGTTITPSSNGVLALLNNTGADFGRLQFGGTTSAFPALQRSGAALRARLADDSANTSITMSNPIITNTATPAAATDACTAGALWADANFIYSCVASGNIKRAAISTW